MFDLSAVALFSCNLLKCFERFALKLILPYVGCVDIFSLVELHFAFFKAEGVGYVVGEDDAVVLPYRSVRERRLLTLAVAREHRSHGNEHNGNE